MKRIETEDEYQTILTRITELWEAKPNTTNGDELDKLADLVVEFEEDMELIRLVESRKDQPEIAVELHDL
ncbi:hypothetical protein [Psychromonas antarctica]|uniref:hypothetical protein n=1 Tax=Psychromonas antarctica TaxID=67573 RepID=UPI001EE89EB0|nr:hypothetical protein [Psychromonas antarctica]MCG6202686.1 hypothetical protein [Psychromonas antarctica]